MSMIVGVCTIELRMREVRSLKGKRQIMNSITKRVKNNFNVSIAEVDYQDKWQRASLGVSCVAESISQCRKVMQEVERQIERASADGGEIVDRHTEIVAMEDLL